jgi:hypothetical protein
MYLCWRFGSVDGALFKAKIDETKKNIDFSSEERLFEGSKRQHKYIPSDRVTRTIFNFKLN